MLNINNIFLFTKYLNPILTTHEFHVLEVIARLPPLLATVFSRSSCGWAGVSLNVTKILIFDFQGSDRGMENYSSIYIKSLFKVFLGRIFIKNLKFYLLHKAQLNSLMILLNLHPIFLWSTL
mgnify:CR=1 FL=1